MLFKHIQVGIDTTAGSYSAGDVWHRKVFESVPTVLLLWADRKHMAADILHVADVCVTVRTLLCFVQVARPQTALE